MYLICVYANKATLCGYILFLTGICLAVVTHELLYFLLIIEIGLGFLVATLFGSCTYNAYKIGIKETPEKVEKRCKRFNMNYCTRVGYELALHKLTNPKLS